MMTIPEQLKQYGKARKTVNLSQSVLPEIPASKKIPEKHLPAKI